MNNETTGRNFDDISVHLDPTTAHAVLEIAPHLAVCVTLGTFIKTVITFHYPDRSVELFLADCEDITPTVERVYAAASHAHYDRLK